MLVVAGLAVVAVVAVVAFAVAGTTINKKTTKSRRKKIIQLSLSLSLFP